MENAIYFDDSLAKLVTRDRLVMDAVYKALSYKVPGFEFTDRYKEGLWDGTLSFLDRRDWTFPPGLIDLVTEAFARRKMPLEIIDQRNHSRGIKELKSGTIEACLLDRTLRDYQVAAVEAIFTKIRGVIQAPTGSGKTTIAAGAIRLAWEDGLKTLFLTHKKELLHQTAASIHKSTGIEPGIIGDGAKDTGKKITVGTVQTLANSFTRKKGSTSLELRTFLKGIDFLILDECHHADAATWEMVCDGCERAYYRIGLTATPLMKGQVEDMKLMAVTGGIICRITLQDLIDRGLLAQPYVKFIRIPSPLLNQKMNWQSAYKNGVVYNAFRNKQIVFETMKLVGSDRQVLILVNQIEHGEILYRTLGGVTRCNFIDGSKKTAARQAAFEAIQNGDLNVLISSTITDEGVDIPAISSVILAGGWKSPIKLYQRIGRGMRPKEGDNSVYIIDFIDLTQRHLAHHSLERYKLIKNEPGFIIVSDFDSIVRKAA